MPGHEIIGKVAAVGENVSQWRVGDRIGGPWHGGHDGTTLLIRNHTAAIAYNGTGTCPACQKGHFQMCDLGIINGVTKNGGCMYALPDKRRQVLTVQMPNTVSCALRLVFEFPIMSMLQSMLPYSVLE